MHKAIYKPLDWQLKGLQETASGFGGKLTTRYMINYKGRLRRVYSCCYSNNGTLYVKIKGKDEIVEIEV